MGLKMIMPPVVWRRALWVLPCVLAWGLMRVNNARPRVLLWEGAIGASYPDALTLAWQSNGVLHSAHEAGDVRLWDASQSQTAPRSQTSLQGFEMFGSATPLVQFSRDGKLAWAAQGRDEVALWDAATGRQRTRFHVGPCQQVAPRLSPDGRLLAIGGETEVLSQDRSHAALPARVARGWIQVWDWKSSLPSPVWKASTHSPVAALGWSGNGMLASVGGDTVPKQGASYDVGGEFLLWDLAKTNPITRRQTKASLSSVALSEDGKIAVVSGLFSGTALLDARTGSTLRVLSRPLNVEDGVTIRQSPLCEQMEFSRDGRVVAGLNKSAFAWRVSDGELLGKWNTTRWSQSQSEPTDNALALSPQSDELAVGSSRTREITLYQLP